MLTIEQKIIEAMPTTVKYIKQQYPLDLELEDTVLYPEIEMNFGACTELGYEKQGTLGYIGVKRTINDYEGYLDYDDEY